MAIDDARQFRRRIQPSGRAAWRRQGTIGELADADAASFAGPWGDRIPRDAFGGALDDAASRFPRVVSDGRDLSRTATGRSSAPARSVHGDVRALRSAVRGQMAVDPLRRACRRTRART